MNALRFLFIAVATGVAMWLAGGIWHEIVAAHFYSPGAVQAHEGILLILVAYLVLGALMVLFHLRLYPEGASLGQSLKFGAIVGVLWVFPHSLSLAAAHGDPLPYVFQNAAWHIVEQSIGALVLHAARNYSNTWLNHEHSGAGH